MNTDIGIINVELPVTLTDPVIYLYVNLTADIPHKLIFQTSLLDFGRRNLEPDMTSLL